MQAVFNWVYQYARIPQFPHFPNKNTLTLFKSSHILTKLAANSISSTKTYKFPMLILPHLVLLMISPNRTLINTLRPRQNGRNFADDTFKYIFLNENVWIPIKMSLKFVPNGPINNIPALVQIMAWRRPGDKPLSEPMVVSLPTHICVARPQWVRYSLPGNYLN